jgi:hypothetical protein
VLWALSVVARVVIFALALIAILILTPILWLLDGRSLRLRPINADPREFGRGGILDQAAEQANSTPDPIRYALALVALFVLFAGMTKFVLRRRPRRRAERPDEERQVQRPVIDLAGLIAALLQALGLRPARQESDPLAALRVDPRWAATVAIRERYRAFLAWSAGRGAPRPASATPAEHAALVGRLLKGGQGGQDVPALVAIYERARYGPEPASPSEAEQMEAAWQRVQSSRSEPSGKR